MLSKNNIILVYLFTALFIALNLYFCAQNMYLLSLLPLGLATILFVFFSLDKVILLITFFTPLSFELRDIIPSLSFNVNLPTEPLLIAATFVFFLKLVTEKRFDKKVLVHPVSIAIYLYLAWIFMSSIMSSMPMVSFKFLAAKIWFIVCYYFLVTQLCSDKKNIKNYVWAYALGLLIVVVYVIISHSFHNFSQKSANWIVYPFYRDHTSYGAALAFILPGIWAVKSLSAPNINIRIMHLVVMVLLFIGLVLSYTRGAWIGIIAIVGIWIVIKLKISLRNIFIVLAALLLIVVPIKDDILHSLEKNDEVSSTDMFSHAKSISNISTDASNLERLNRWSCAYRMFLDRPFWGWGPGTYLYQYAPFQLAKDRTVISTNASDNGNAHSEYLGPLSETGFFGPITVLLILFLTMRTGFRVYYKSTDLQSKHVALYLTLALITYYLHGVINNFLDTDKISALFWGFTAILVALDVYHFDNKKEILQ